MSGTLPVPPAGAGLPRLLSIAGSDSSGGAGIQADLKTFAAHGVYGMTAITAITAQNTLGVSAVQALPPALVAAQIDAVFADPGVDAVKIGMLAETGIIDAVAACLLAAPGASAAASSARRADRRPARPPVVLDPVMIAKSGNALLDADAVDHLQRLFPLATLLTPNLPEAEALLGRAIPDAAAMAEAAMALRGLGPAAVLLKGGHAEGPVVVDVLADAQGTLAFESPRIATRHTHGTGCTLASAVATGIAQGMALRLAVGRARAYVLEALRSAPGFGHGHGPLDHAHTLRADVVPAGP